MVEALLAQHRFLIDKFCLLVQQLQSPLFLDQHYIGPIFGNLGRGMHGSLVEFISRYEIHWIFKHFL